MYQFAYPPARWLGAHTQTKPGLRSLTLEVNSGALFGWSVEVSSLPTRRPRCSESALMPYRSPCFAVVTQPACVATATPLVGERSADRSCGRTRHGIPGREAVSSKCPGSSWPSLASCPSTIETPSGISHPQASGSSVTLKFEVDKRTSHSTLSVS